MRKLLHGVIRLRQHDARRNGQNDETTPASSESFASPKEAKPLNFVADVRVALLKVVFPNDTKTQQVQFGAGASEQARLVVLQPLAEREGDFFVGFGFVQDLPVGESDVLTEPLLVSPRVGNQILHEFSNRCHWCLS